MACSINFCATHFNNPDLKRPCSIVLNKGFLLIHPNKVTYEVGSTSNLLYEVTFPFTREELACLNDIDSEEPDEYVNALKVKKRCQHKPLAGDMTEQTLRQQLTIEKALVRQHLKTIQEKDREITMLKLKLNI